MNDFATDELALRLATLEPRVDAARVTHRVLASSHSRQGVRTYRMRFAAVAVPVVLLMVGVLSSYFVPAFAQALADAPLAGGVTGWMLRNVGLAGVPHRITSFGDVATSSGYEGELVGGYADSGRTILFVRVTPAARIPAVVPLGKDISLTDQFGESYRMTGAIENSETGENTLIFEALRWPASVVGARLRLTLQSLEVGLVPRTTKVMGAWILTGTLARDESADLSLPADGFVGPMHVSITSVRATASAILVELRLEPDGLDLHRSVPDGVKGHPAFAVRLRDASGADRPSLQASYGTRGAPGELSGSWMWLIERPGSYDIEVSYEGVGALTRTVVVP